MADEEAARQQQIANTYHLQGYISERLSIWEPLFQMLRLILTKVVRPDYFDGRFNELVLFQTAMAILPDLQRIQVTIENFYINIFFFPLYTTEIKLCL